MIRPLALKGGAAGARRARGAAFWRACRGWLVALALLPVLHGAPVAAASEAEAFVHQLGDSTVVLFADKAMTDEARRAQFKEILRKGFDLDRIGQFVAGRAWRDASPDQRRRYIGVFESYVVDTYYVRFSGYAGETFRVQQSLPVENGDHLVRTEIQRGGGEAPLRVDYRVTKDGGALRIIDVIVEGVSLLVTHRQEFGAVINRQGLDGLIKILEERSISIIKS